MEKVNRQSEFDIIKAFAIFLVLWGHCIQHLLSSDPKEDEMYRLIYSFHMPLFMMVSGYFCTHALNMPFRAVFEKKFKQLIVPCITMGGAIWGVWSLLFLVIKGVIPSPMELLDSILINYWFLKSLFLCYLLSWCGHHLIRNIYLWMFLTLVASQFIPFYNVSIMYPAFIGGII